MEIRREAVGRGVEAYTLETGWLAATVWTYGATLVEALVPGRDGRRVNVVRRLPDLAAYEASRQYVGATVGRYARCIAGGSFRLDGVAHELHRNAGRHHVHGGSVGFDRLVWRAEAAREGDELVLALRLERPDGDEGYPGAVSVETAYRVGETSLAFEHHATTTASTVCDVTNHAFWNLAGGGTIDGHLLAVNATRVLLVDDELIPVGAPVPVAGTPFDHSTPRRLGGRRLDNCFALDDPLWAAELSDPASGRAMRIVSDQPGLQVYSGDGFVEPRGGICLQTGAWPNSPNRPDFPSSRLDPGRLYVHRTRHEFRLS